MSVSDAHDLAVGLPAFNALLQRADGLVPQIKLGHSAFLRHVGCHSEAEYKQQCMRAGHIMYHAHLIGMTLLPLWLKPPRRLRYSDVCGSKG